MAATPRFKVHDSHKVYQASCKEIEAAAVLMGFYGENAFIRDGSTNTIVWTEGKDGEACISYDAVAVKVWDRINRLIQARKEVENPLAWSRAHGIEEA